MSDPKFSSDLTVVTRRVWGSDKDVPETARVSSAGFEDLVFHEDEVALTDGDINLIELLADNGHTSPFEHMGATFYLHVPIFVMREWMRHRTQSYNEESGRWRVLEGQFYVPDADRPVKQVGRTGEYSFEPDEWLNSRAAAGIKNACSGSWSHYETLLELGVAKEVARMCLPVNIYTRVIVTANFLNWVRFLNLRAQPQAMYEIRQAAFQVQEQLRKYFPYSMKFWFPEEGE